MTTAVRSVVVGDGELSRAVTGSVRRRGACVSVASSTSLVAGGPATVVAEGVDGESPAVNAIAATVPASAVPIATVLAVSAIGATTFPNIARTQARRAHSHVLARIVLARSLISVRHAAHSSQPAVWVSTRAIVEAAASPRKTVGISSRTERHSGPSTGR